MLGGLSTDAFLRRHWQKRPLLVRQALPGFKGIATPAELAGLACTDGVNSRLVMERGGDYPWQARNGPFTAGDLRRLPLSNWTLLVTDIDRHLRAGADLVERFRFLPSWRVDDLMISYAVPGGSVGPHTDSYDVFLLQARGRRRWQINHRRYRDDDCIPGLDLRILAQFEPAEEWIVEPGDLLYLPPDMAHYGVALDECMTCSIGFRAPTQRELLKAWCDHAAGTLDPARRYADPDLRRQGNAGEIDGRARRRIRDLIRSVPRGDADIDDWFGRFITETGPWQPPPPPSRPMTRARFLATFARTGHLYRDDRSRFAWIRRGAAATLYVDAAAYPLSRRATFAAPLLAGQREFSHAELAARLGNEEFVTLLLALRNRGHLSFRRQLCYR